ncbi:MAG: hypothetical protein ACJ75J_13555 [Cytophagaceae bacterium]
MKSKIDISSLVFKGVIFFLIVGLISCKREVSVQDFLNHVNTDKDFVKKYADDIFHAQCVYNPPQVMALTELRGTLEQQGRIDSTQFNKALKSFSGASYFSFKLGLTDSNDIFKKDIRSREEYVYRINDIEFNMGKHAYFLTQNRDTVRASIFDMQRSYGMSQDLTMIFAFPSERLLQENSTVNFVYDDIYFGLSHPLVFSFDPKQLKKKLPEIQL